MLNRINSDALSAAKAACAAMDDKFGKDIVLLDISDISPLADFFIITTCLNPVQMRTMSEACEKALSAAGFDMARSEGGGSGWYLMDHKSVIVHVFSEELRSFYNLERIWADAKEIDWHV